MAHTEIKHALDRVLQSAGHALRWRLPEQWIQTELFSKLSENQEKADWIPLIREVPYVTRYPFTLPSGKNRDWATQGAVKWVDMCLHTPDRVEWTWLELKVRHSASEEREEIARKSARNAFAKDLVGLAGFDIEQTAQIWDKPDWASKSYWFESYLAPMVDRLRNGKHHRIAIYLELSSESGSDIWPEEEVRQEVERWHRTRSRKSQLAAQMPDYCLESYRFEAGHWMMMASV